MGWGIYRNNIFDGTCDPLIEDDPLSHANVTEAASDLYLDYNTSGIWWSGQGVAAYESVQTAGTMLRRWWTTITSHTGTSSGYGCKAGLVLFGATSGADYGRGISITIGRSGMYGSRFLQVHVNGGSVVLTSAAWAEGDIPIDLMIEEQTRFDVGDTSVSYMAKWRKSGGNWTNVYELSSSSIGTWAAKYIGIVGWYNAPMDVHYSHLTTEVWDDDYPTIDTFDPADREAGVDTSDAITFNCNDATSGVNTAGTSIQIRLGAGASWATAVTGGSAEPGYTWTALAVIGGYACTLTPATALPINSEIGVRIHVEDLIGNATEQEIYFWTDAGAIAEDLAERYGTRHRFMLLIDGLEPILWEGDGSGGPPASGWSRSGKVCLLRPTEKSMELDLGEMRGGLGQMTFDLTDIQNADGTSYFGQQFAAARWDSVGHARIAEGTDYNQQVEANATTIPVDSSVANLPASGTVHILSQAASYTGKTGTTSGTITGCVLGINSCTWLAGADARPWGAPIARPQANEAGSLPAVSTVPFSWIGRRVALWVTTWDRRTGTWRTEAQTQSYGPVWVGRISQGIDFDPKRNVWKMVCTSAMNDLEETKIAVGLPQANLSGINLSGLVTQDNGTGLAFIVWETHGGSIEGSIPVYYTPGHYTAESLLATLSGELATTPWTAYGSATVAYPRANVSMLWRDGKTVFRGELATPADYAGERALIIEPRDLYVWRALGFEGDSLHIPLAALDVGAVGEAESPGNYYISFHPLHRGPAGHRMYVDTPGRFWATQGDYGRTVACAMIDEAVIDPANNVKGRFPFRYTARSAEYLTLDNLDSIVEPASLGHVGQRFGEEPVVVRQVYIPYAKNRGPFRILLEILSSTGTPGYNGTYDVLPRQLAGRIEQHLIDADSFLAADAEVMSTGLANRQLCVIDGPVSLAELVSRESKLFGKPLVWARGKLRISDVMLPPVFGDEAEQLDDSNTYGPGEWPKVTQSIDTVVNAYEVSGYNVGAISGKSEGRTITVDDADSVGCFGTRKISIKHPGLYISKELGATVLKGLLEAALRNRPLRFPSQVITRSLAPYMMGRVHVGEAVRLVSSQIYDPAGSGSKGFNGWAVPLMVKWNYTNMAGTVTLLLLSQYAGYGDPWCPGARAYDWSAANYRLTLYDHTFSDTNTKKDGFAFEAGDKVIAIERNATDGAAAYTQSMTVASAFETDGAGILTMDPVTFTYWDAYRTWDLTFDSRSIATTDQKARGTWLADEDSEMLNSGTESAQRFG